ncbi:MAG: glyoxalase [Lachnospiraceae bacterium]|nr:glyoxalase [Lachnospiraceae bacterium]
MTQFDEAVLDAFLGQQGKLFPENVADTREEADDFLAECMAVVVNGKKEVWDYFEEEGIDIAEINEDEILEADEVFDVGDGRYLIVEC